MDIERCKKLAKVTTREQLFLDMLERSYLDLTKPFSAKEAVIAIKETPCKKGSRLKDVPTHHRVFVILKKSGKYTMLNGKGGCRTWVASQ